jgi:hypothetical protein
MTRSLSLVLFAGLLCGCASTSKPGEIQLPKLPEESRLATIGRSTYFILEPGYRLVLTDEDGDETLIMTVTEDTRHVGQVQTRVVEEREMDHGEVKEISRNFLAIDKETGDIWYFGEEVDNYKDGQVTDHKSAWMAFENGARPGILIPGKPVIGMKMYQEHAPGVAMDWFEVAGLDETVTTPMGVIKHCLKTAEGSDVESGTEYKYYAPNVGPVVDDEMKLKAIGSTNAH